MIAPVVIASGGTGGHMFPAMALARELARRGRPVHVIADARGARYADVGTRLHVIQSASPSGSVGRRAMAMARLAVGAIQSASLLARLRPSALASFGSYAAFLPAFLAQLFRVPLLIHEQNAVLGRSHRVVAGRARALALTFAATRGQEVVDAARRIVTGNPVRPEIMAEAGAGYEAPVADGPLELLIFGGSQGARVFSDVVPAAVQALPEDARKRLRIVQQCRPEDMERVRAAYGEAGIAVELATFFDDIAKRMARAHLVVSRSGASTVAELLVLGRPSLLVPYAHAADDHQSANAVVLAEAGAAWTVPEKDFGADVLAARLQGCLDAPGALADLARNARELARPEAAGALADAVEALIPEGRP